jgi:N-acetylmuramoyl-L-alanine amidase
MDKANISFPKSARVQSFGLNSPNYRLLLQRCASGRRILRKNLFLLFFIAFVSGFPVFSPPSLMAQTMSLDEALTSLGSIGVGMAEFRWDPFFSSGVLSAGGHEAAFFSGRPGETGIVLMDHREIINLPLPYLEGGNLRFPETFVSQLKSTFSRYIEEDRGRFKIAAIIIDPGHGGRDSGASWEYNIQGRVLKAVEKEITLKVGLMLYGLLNASYPDKRILLTRNDDSNPSLEQRVTMANSVPLAPNEVAIYISIHANSSFNRNARGFEVWYLTPTYRRELVDHSRYTDTREIIPILNTMLEEGITTESILIANFILRRLQEAVGDMSHSRGLKAYDWFVVRNARMPSVLVELGFLSNESEAILLSDDAYLKKLSEALYKGISDFINLFERAGGLAVSQ